MRASLPRRGQKGSAGGFKTHTRSHVKPTHPTTLERGRAVCPRAKLPSCQAPQRVGLQQSPFAQYSATLGMAVWEGVVRSWASRPEETDLGSPPAAPRPSRGTRFLPPSPLRCTQGRGYYGHCPGRTERLPA